MIPEIVAKHGACKGTGPDDFYTDSGFKKTTAKPIPLPSNHICFRCPVRPECREYALRKEPYGSWGGLTENELYWERKRLHIRQPPSGIGVIVMNGKPV